MKLMKRSKNSSILNSISHEAKIPIQNYNWHSINFVRILENFFLLYFLDGKSLAMKYGVKYIETSPGINHNVDELLVRFQFHKKLRM